jgi:hypothetical protein
MIVAVSKERASGLATTRSTAIVRNSSATARSCSTPRSVRS